MSHFWKYKTNYDSLEPHFDNFRIAQVTANQRQRHISSPSAAFGWREPMHVATLHKTCLREPETNQFARCSEQGKNSISSWLLNMQESSGARAPRFLFRSTRNLLLFNGLEFCLLFSPCYFQSPRAAFECALRANCFESSWCAVNVGLRFTLCLSCNARDD